MEKIEGEMFNYWDWLDLAEAGYMGNNPSDIKQEMVELLGKYRK